ncbi:hypothetical protein EJB05_16978, partial [Eragrostis curvula]
MEEFQEAEVLWPDAHQHHHRDDCPCHRRSHTDHQQQPRSTARAAQQQSSAPVRIPAMPAVEALSKTSRYSWARGHDNVIDDDDDDDDRVIVRRASGAEAAIVPPHVLAARRCAAERRVASSVCVGHGRTLKGRDLRAVRDAVLHMTGFLSNSDEH